MVKYFFNTCWSKPIEF